MYGSNVNRLSMYLGNTGQLGTRLWTKTGNQGFAWHYAEVEIGAVTSMQIIFEALHGNGYLGDIALDDIMVLQGACPAPGMHNTFPEKKSNLR